MSVRHNGNMLNEMTFEEHDGLLNAKKVSMVSSATLYVVSNVGNAQLSGNVTLNPSPNFIGIVTVANPGSAQLSGNVTLDPGSRTGVVGNVTLSDSKGFIGLTTTTLSASPAFIGIVTIANPNSTNSGNVTLNPSPNFIGIVTVANPGSAGNVTLDPGSKTGIVGNVTLSDSTTFIGLTTTVIGRSSDILGPGNTSALFTSTASGTLLNISIRGPAGRYAEVLSGSDAQGQFAGLANFSQTQAFSGSVWDRVRSGLASNASGLGTLAAAMICYDGTAFHAAKIDATGNIQSMATIYGGSVGISGNVTLSDSKANIGLVTLTGGTAWTDPKTYIGLATVNNATAWPDPKGFIGLVTIVGSLSPAAGNITLDPGSKTQIVGNVTLSDSKGFIGLVTLGGGTAWTDPKTYIGLVTIGHTANVAVVGNVTLSDSKGFIGLVTTIPGRFSGQAIGSPAGGSFTLTLASLASGFCRSSTLLSNISGYPAALVYAKVSAGGVAPNHGSQVEFFLIRGDGTVYDDNVSATDSNASINNAPLLGTINLFSLVSAGYQAVFDTSPLGPLGTYWGIAARNNSAWLSGTEANHVKNFLYYVPESR